MDVHRIRSACQRGSYNREHWTKKKGNWKPKKCFYNLAEGEDFIKRHKYKNYQAYVCSECGCVHIGYKKEQS